MVGDLRVQVCAEGLLEVALSALPVGDVAGDQRDPHQLAAHVLDRGNGERDLDPAPVLSHGRDLIVLGASRLAHGGECLLLPFRRVLREAPTLQRKDGCG